MASHISYPLIDSSKRPASFSKVLLDKILRKDLGFKGIVLTDDIQMKGARLDNLSLGERAVQAVLAGNDIIMVGWNFNTQKKVIQAVTKAVKNGRISKDRLYSSLKRILKYKQRFYKKPSGKSIKTELKNITLTKTYDKIFDRVFANQTMKELTNSNSVEVYSYSWRFLTSYKKRAPAKLKHLKRFRGWKRASRSKTIIYHLSGSSSERILRSAPENIRKRIVVVNSSSKASVTAESQFKKVIHIYSYHPKLGSFAAKHIKSAADIRQPAAVKKR